MRIALFLIAFIASFAAAIPQSIEAQSITSPLTCNTNPDGATPSPARPNVFYPAPGPGVPDARSLVGEIPMMICGWPDRTFRTGEPTQICASPYIDSIGRVATTLAVSSETACLHVTGNANAGSLPIYPIATVTCHTPLHRATAPNAAFYAAETAMVSNAIPTPPDSCVVQYGGTTTTSMSFCAPTQLGDTPWLDQLYDLEHPGFYRFLAHMMPSCAVYMRSSLTFLGQTQPSASSFSSPSPTPTPSQSPAAKITPIPRPTLRSTPPPIPLR